MRAPNDAPAKTPANGLLGADYTIANGRWRFAEVYAGENWNPLTVAPLTGLSSLTGYAGDVPREVGISYGDPNADADPVLHGDASRNARTRH